MKAPLVVLLCGCPLNTGNNGVSALAVSAIQGLVSIEPDCHIIIQHFTGQESQVDVWVDGKTKTLETVFFHGSKRFVEWKGLKFANMISYFIAPLPRVLQKKLFSFVPLFDALFRADVVLDISGGDSFTSIYGDAVFDSVTRLKNIALRIRKPLVLLPQSYGRFDPGKHLSAARKIFRQSRLICCRDLNGPESLAEIVPEVAADRVVSCPDLAFSMKADTSLNHLLGEYFGIGDGKPIVGLNVSGLLYSGKINFKLRCDYIELMHMILDWLIDDVGARVVLIAHVVSTAKMKKSKLVNEYTDAQAIALLHEELDDAKKAKVFALPEIDDPRRIKGVIGCCDYFIGARMHACIGAISQSVPTTCLAYSDKFAGVMDLAGHENLVADLRAYHADELVRRIQQSFDRRADEKQRLATVNATLNIRIEDFLHRDLGPVLAEERD